MSETNSPKQTQEIDLLELFSKFFKGIGNGILYFIKGLTFLIIFGLKRIHFLILFGIAGVLIGLMLFRSTSRYYSSSLVAQPNGITSDDMINYINDLQQLCKERNIEGLAYSLDMKDTVAGKIKNIQAFYYVDVNKDGIGDYVDYKNQFNRKDTTQKILEDRIYLTVEVFDNSIFNDVKNGLIKYIRKNPYLIKLNEIRKQELIELIAQTEYEISKLDSLQNTEYFGDEEKIRVQESQMMFLTEKDQYLFYRDKLNLLSKKQEYQKEIELATDAVTIIKDFTPLTVAENPRGKYIVRNTFYFTVLGYFLLLILHFRKNIINFVKF